MQKLDDLPWLQVHGQIKMWDAINLATDVLDKVFEVYGTRIAQYAGAMIICSNSTNFTKLLVGDSCYKCSEVKYIKLDADE